MSTAPVSSRPVTSKSRGICKYYTTDRGCFAGSNCKFLHGPAATHTPYDQAKTCRFYAAGFCKRGAQCWFPHTKGKEKEVIEDEDDLCSICFDKPVTYGLLTGCSHIFCITCIKQWRDPQNKSVDVVDSGNIKRCPMCRQPAKFIIPSSKFYAQGEAKDAAMARYMDSMKRVPCKHFQKSLSSARAIPFCPFGKDCFYQHRNPDGSDHVTTQGVDACMRQYASRRETQEFGFPLADMHRSGLIRQLETVFAESARLGLGPRMPGFPDDGVDDNALIRRRLEILADQMLASLAGQDPHSDSEGPTDEEDNAMPPLERISPRRAEDWPLPLMFDSDTDGEMPALASVSNSSDDEAESESSDDDEEVDRYSSTQELGDVFNERMPNVRPFDLVVDPDIDLRDDASNRNVFMRLRHFLDDIARADADSGNEAEASTSTRALDAADPPAPVLRDQAADEEDEEADDESDMPSLEPEHEPPFVTDGRGRVVWSSSSDSGAGYSQQAASTSSSAPRRASVSVPGAFLSGPSTNRAVPAEKPPSPRQTTSEGSGASRQAGGEGGFTTDGRGRVIGTTGTRDGEEHEAQESGGATSETPVPTRSFFGRVLGAFF
ncbi:hypothetical protein MVEN_01009300 [Mycena venus]|uniref:RING-type E3 ubiquitin transferase n=1 Tax=Mycena venus TaxID=2733690 RepID=A0A8H7D2W0_9AGAR|nr:hypothetical protein MVEN_01009300 [Mycena venus]